MATTEYATLAELKTTLGITTSNEDTHLTTALAAASRSIDLYCARRFYVDDAVSARIYTPEFNDVLFIDDVASLTGLIVESDTTDDGAYDTTWTLDDRVSYGYRMEPINALSGAETAEQEPFTRIAAVSSEFPISRYSMQVTALYGFPSVPSTIVSATLEWTARLWKRKDAVLGVAGGQDIGFVELAKRLDPDIERNIKPFRKMHVGGV